MQVEKGYAPDTKITSPHIDGLPPNVSDCDGAGRPADGIGRRRTLHLPIGRSITINVTGTQEADVMKVLIVYTSYHRMNTQKVAGRWRRRRAPPW